MYPYPVQDLNEKEDQEGQSDKHDRIFGRAHAFAVLIHRHQEAYAKLGFIDPVRRPSKALGKRSV